MFIFLLNNCFGRCMCYFRDIQKAFFRISRETCTFMNKSYICHYTALYFQPLQFFYMWSSGFFKYVFTFICFPLELFYIWPYIWFNFTTESQIFYFLLFFSFLSTREKTKRQTWPKVIINTLKILHTLRCN